MDNAVGRGVLNGWQLSGISTLASGVPVCLGFGGQAGSDDVTQAHLRHAGHHRQTGPRRRRPRRPRADLHLRSAARWQRRSGEKILDINCIGIPAFGENGTLLPPYNLRMPTRINHDLTLFKNFAITGEQKLQFRVGFFNIFNQAWATTNVGRRHRPGAGHRLQPHGERRAQRRRRHGRQRLRPDRWVRIHRHHEERTSGRST